MSKTILITGATGGIGTKLCHHLANKGYNLILSSRTQNKLEQLKSEIKKSSNVDIKTIKIDFSDSKAVEDTKLEQLTDTLDGLVIMPAQAVATDNCLPATDVWQSLFATSFINPLSLIRNAMPLLEKSDRAKVVVVSGISSVQVLGHYATSNVLRAAWLAEAKTLAFKYGPKNIHFNTLSLGGVLTDKYQAKLMGKADLNERTLEEQMKIETGNVPLGKYGKPEEVSAAIEGLLSSFSDHITGMNIVCDGGFTRAY